MSKSISRRTVLAATVVAILALTGGYVVAATLTGIYPSQTNQSAGSVMGPGNTIFASGKILGSINITLTQTPTTTCDQNGTWSFTQTTATVFANGAATCENDTQPGYASEWFEELSWSGVQVPGILQNDTFYITVGTSTTTYGYSSFWVADQLGSAAGAFTGQLDVFLAAGPATDGSLPTAYTSISIAVSGT